MYKQRFPLISVAFNDAFGSIMRRYIKTHGPLSSVIPSIPLFEGAFIADDTSGARELQTASGTAKVDNQIIRDVNILAFREKLKELTHEMLANTERGLIASLDQQLSNTEQSVSAEGHPFSWEVFLATLEKLDWSFDLRGHWVPQTIVLHPNLYPHVMQVLNEAGKDPEKIRQFRGLEARKRVEFNDREASRKLVE